MSRIPAPLLLLAALGLVLALPGGANACCLHGLLRCEVCGGGQGYYVGGTLPPQPGPPTPPPQPGPSQPGGGGAPPLPSLAPSLPYPGAALDQAAAAPAAPRVPYGYGAAAPSYAYGYGAAAPSYSYGYGAAAPSYGYNYGYGAAAPAYGYSYGYGAAAPSYGYGYGAAAPSYGYGAAAPLKGYSSAAPILPVVPGQTPLSNGQLTGSHIFHVLGQFGRGLSKSGLLEKAVGAFFDVNGIMPTPDERQILEDIVARFLGGSGPGPTEPGKVAGDGGNGSANVIRIVVTLEVPPGVQVDGVQAQGGSPATKKVGTEAKTGTAPPVPSLAPAAPPPAPPQPAVPAAPKPAAG